MRPTDRNYLIKSWVMSIRSQFPFSEMSSTAIAKYAKRVEALLGVADTLVACDPKNEDVVYGFVCYEAGEYLGRQAPTLHYVWTRKQFRRLGVAGQMVREALPGAAKIIYTHYTKEITRARLKEKWNLGEFDPYFVEGALYSKARNFDARAIYRGELAHSLRVA
jgi:hypothetical protein